MEILRLKDVGLEAAVKKAVTVLAKGGIIIYPTDTLYGLGVDARNPQAVTRLKQLKGRELKKPIAVIVQDVDHIEECGLMNDHARALAEKYFPGPLTLVLPAHLQMPEDVMLHGTIGVRIPNNEFCLALARAFNGPITTTSANKAGLATPNFIDDMVAHFGPKISEVDLLIDGGELGVSPPSTVVSCVRDTCVLREGAIPKSDLGL